LRNSWTWKAALQHRTEIVQPDANGVTGILLDRTTGAETPFMSRYLIAAEVRKAACAGRSR
jgi:hypothetical protein